MSKVHKKQPQHTQWPGEACTELPGQPESQAWLPAHRKHCDWAPAVADGPASCQKKLTCFVQGRRAARRASGACSGRQACSARSLRSCAASAPCSLRSHRPWKGARKSQPWHPWVEETASRVPTAVTVPGKALDGDIPGALVAAETARRVACASPAPGKVPDNRSSNAPVAEETPCRHFPRPCRGA